MIKMSMIRNCPVVCAQKQIGLVQSLVMDSARIRVQALIVSGGLKGKRILPVQLILAIADDYILAKGFRNYKRSAEPALSSFVRDSKGHLVGYVTDYAFDERTFQMLAIEMITGYLPKERRNRIWLYTYHCTTASDMIIPTPLNSEPIFSRKEEKSCVCPP